MGMAALIWVSLLPVVTLSSYCTSKQIYFRAKNMAASEKLPIRH